jgi:hypothetical protein
LNRRDFVKDSLVIGNGALFARCGLAAIMSSSQEHVSGSIAPSEINNARFPEGFLWGMASAIAKIPIGLNFASNLQTFPSALKRFQVLNQIVFLLFSKPEVETVVIAVDDIQKCLETPIVIEAAFVLRKHKQAAFAHKQARQVHRLICMAGRAIGFEAIDLQLAGRVLVPTWFRPQWLMVAAIAIGPAAE